MAKSPKNKKPMSLSTKYILEMAHQMSQIQINSFKAGVEYQKQIQKNEQHDKK